MNKQNLVAMNELVGAMFLADLDKSDLSSLQSDAKSYIESNSGISLESGTNFSVVENSGDTVHLALPYYSMVDSMSSVELTKEQMDAVSGGEIFISIGILVGCVGGGIAAATTAGVVAGGVVGGVAGAAVVAGVAGGAAHAHKKNSGGK